MHCDMICFGLSCLKRNYFTYTVGWMGVWRIGFCIEGLVLIWTLWVLYGASGYALIPLCFPTLIIRKVSSLDEMRVYVLNENPSKRM